MGEPNPTITIDLEVNGAKATQSINNFKDDAIEKLESISKVQDSIDPVLSTLQLDKSLIGSGEAFDSFAESMIAANTAATQMKKTLNSFVSSINIGRLSDGMTQMFESAYRTMISSVKSFNDEIDRGLSKGPRDNKTYSSADQNIRLATATGLSASADMLRLLRIANNAQKETGLSASQIDQIMPALYSITKNKTDEYRRSTRSTPRLNELASFVASQDLFRKTATGSIKGYNPTEHQLEQLAKAAVVSTRHNAYRDNLSILQAAGLKGNEYEYVTDQLPNVFKNAYIYYGRSGAKQEGYTLNNLAGEAAASREVYRNYRRLVQNGNQQAIRLGLDVGLLRASNGYYQFSGGANMAQMNTMAGLAAQVAGNAKSSLPYYYTHRNDQTSEGQRKLLGRQNNVFNDALELMEVLSGESRLTPDAYGYVGFSRDPRSAIKSNAKLFQFQDNGKDFRKFNKNAVRIQTLGVADQYVVPKTYLDNNGNLVWRDPSWQKEDGVQEKKDDHFATVGNSALTWLLDMYGNNTYGYGRNDDGKADYQAPKILRVNTSQLYKQVSDKNGTRMIVDPARQEEANRINRLFARQETASYGKPGEKAKDYIAAFGDAESLTMIQKDDYDAIVKKFTDLGMANPFDNMNTGGLFNSGDYKNAAKMIDVGKKKATPGFQYSLLGYNKNPNAALVDFEKLYDYLNIPKSDQLMRSSQRLDGLALFDPTALGVNAQMRAGLVSKFMGQTTDWRRLLYGSHLLQDAYKSGQNRGLISINKNNAIPGYGTGYSFYMPQIGLGEDEKFVLSDGSTVTGVSGLIGKMNSLAGFAENSPQQKLLNEIRQKYFFDIMNRDYTALLPESTVKNNDKFRIISKNAFEKGGLFENEAGQWAKDLGNGTVALTADQQRRYFNKAVEMSGGYWINRTGYDFRTDKDFLPESLAAAMGADQGALKEQSNANYDEYIHRMQTDDNARIRFLKQTSYGRRLVDDGLYNSDLANRLIQSHINDYEAKRAQGHLFLPEYGIDNLLTGVLPGSIFGNIFESAFGVRASDANKYRKLFSYQDDNDRVFMQTLTGEQSEAVRRNAQIAKLMLSRMPAAPGEYGVGVQNLGDQKAIQRALDMLGVDYSNTVFTNPSLQYKLMTGDYDGDTAWVIRGLNNNQFERMEAIQQYVQNAREKMKEQLAGAPDEEKKKLENNLEAFTNFGSDHFTAQLGMGLSTASIRNSLADLDDSDPDKWIAIAEAIDAYDKNTSEAMKEGKIVKLGAHASREAMEGALFRRFVKQINAYGSGSENANPNLFSTRLPEIKDTATLFDVASNFKAKRRGENVGVTFGNDLDSWLFDQYGYSNSYEAQAARAYGNMFKNIEGGIRLVNRNDIANARLIAVKWNNSLEKDRRAGRNQEEINEEERKLNSFVRRLSQQEESGSLYEDYANKIEQMKQQREDLLLSGVAPDDKNIEGLNKKIEIYKSLTEDMSKPLQVAQENWAEELEKMQADVRERYEKNVELARNNGIDLNGGMQALLGPALSTDIVKAGKINFSDVSPWLYERLNNKKYTIQGVQTFDFDANGRMVKSNAPLNNISFFPYPHDASGILSSKGDILAREMDTKHEWIPFTNTADTVMGTLRHNAFQEAMVQYAKGNTNVDAAKIYEGLLSSASSSASSDFKQLGLSLERDEKTGEYTIGGADQHITDGMRAALGTWNPKTKAYEGGSIANLVNHIIRNGYKVANVEGFNLDANGNYMNSKDVDPDDYSGRGSRFSTKVKNASGEEIQKVGTFAPDLILQDKNGQYSMIDYKSGTQGAWDSIYQMMIYAKDIQEKVQAFQKEGQSAEAARLGWDRYLDDKGNLKFNSFFGYDTSSGKGYRYKFNDKVASEVFAEYKSAIEDKLFDNEEEKIAAERRLASEASKKYGIAPETFERKSTEEAVRTLTKNDTRGEWYSDYLANKFVKDEEALNEIMRTGYAASRRYGDREVGGYSQFASARRQLEDAIDPDTIDKLIKEAERRNDPASVAALLDYQTKVSQARRVLNEGEMYAAQNAFGDVESFMAQQFFGVKESAPLNAFNAVRKRMLDAASIREGLKENKEVYNATTQEWINDDYKKAYERSLEDEAVARETFESYLPQLKDRAIKQNNTQLEKLLSDNQQATIEEDLEQYYQQRFDAIQQYVKQQENNLNEYSKKLNQKDKHGQLVLKSGSKEREIFEELLDNSRNNFLRATQVLENTSGIQESAQRAYEKQIGLVGGDRIKSKADKQKEYLDKIQKDYEEVQDENLNPLRYELHEAMLSGDTDRYREIRKRLDYLYKDTNRRKAKMAEFESLKEEYDTERELESTRQKLKSSQIDQLYTGSGISEKERINTIFLQRKAQAQEYAKTLDKDARREFWKTHQDSDLRAQIEKEYQDNDILRNLRQDNTRASLAARGDINVHNMQRAFNQANRQQQMRYSRSRIAQALYGVEQRRENTREQIYSIERQKEEAQRNQDYYSKQLEIAKKSGDQEKINAAQFGYDQAAQQLTNLSKQSEEAHRQLNELNKGGQTAQAVFGAFGQTIGMVAQRLGRQLFQKALQETKRFVKEFDASMNEIQAITMKSNDEMASVRSSTINRAIGLRTSVSNVATTEAALYRQGLSDTEVASRTESIIKFATVTKLNVAEATKIITTALQNDLVPSAEAAMDALVALGDSAATTAAEIGKGMQKAAASAKVAGVSYQELTALLTIGTSDTQLSGTQVGTALQTVFSRMRRLSLTGYTADQNGEKTTSGDAEAALKAVGVELWDDKTIGKMRSGYEVLLDLSKVWQNLSDAQKNIVMNAMAGTRQTNIFSTLMEGMSEDDGATLEKYLGLAEGSEGITQSKYEIAMQSLAASMDTLKSSWDAVVESFINGGSVTGILEGVSGFLQGIAGLASGGVGGQIASMFSVIAGGIAGLTAACLLAKTAVAPISTLLSVLLGVATTGILGSIFTGVGNLLSPKTDSERLKEESAEDLQKRRNATNVRDVQQSRYNTLISKAERLGEAYDRIKDSGSIAEITDAQNALVESLGNLADAFPDISSEVENSIKNLSQWKDAVEAAKSASEDFSNETTRQKTTNDTEHIKLYSRKEYNDEIKNLASPETISAAQDFLKGAFQFNVLNNSANNGLTFDKNFVMNDVVNAHTDFADIETQEEAQSARANTKANFLYSLYNKTEENKSVRRLVENFLSNNSPEVLKLLQEGHRLGDTEYAEAGAAAYDALMQMLFDPSGKDTALYERKVDQVRRGHIKGQIAESEALPYLVDQLPKNYKLEDIENAIYGYVLSEARDEKGFKSEYFTNGEFSPDKIWEELIVPLLSVEGLTNLVSNPDYLKMPYSVNGQRFYFQDEAEEYAYNNGINFSDIKQDGKPIFSSPEQLINASILANRTESPASILASVVNGQALETTDLTKIAKEEQAAIAKYISDNNEDISMDQALENIQNGKTKIRNLNDEAKNLISNRSFRTLDSFDSVQEMLDTYNRNNLGGVLNTAITGNAEVLSAFFMNRNGKMSDNDFFKVMKNSRPGRTNTSDIIQTIIDSATADASFIETLRSDPAMKGFYDLFKSLVGDAGDEVLNAIQDGIYDANKDLQKQVSKAQLSQKIKEVARFSQYFDEINSYLMAVIEGTNLESMTAVASATASNQNLNKQIAAIDRIISGNVRQGDYETVASTGLFREIELQNGVSEENLTAARRSLINNQSRKQTDLINAMFSAYGLTYNDYLNGETTGRAPVYYSPLEASLEWKENEDKFIKQGLTRDKFIEDYQKQVKGYTEMIIPIDKIAQIENELANSNYIYTTDKNGNAVAAYVAGAEDELSATATTRNYSTGLADRNLFSLYNNILAAESQTATTPEDFEKILGSYDYNRLFEGDENFRNMILGGADVTAFTNYFNRRASGRTGTFLQNNAWALDQLFGQGWQNDIAGAISGFSAQDLLTGDNNEFYRGIITQLGGENLLNVLTGEGNVEEAIKTISSTLSSDYLYSLANAEQIALDRYAINNGTTAERLSMFGGYNDELRALQQAQYGLNNGNTAENRGYIASVLGLSDAEIDSMLQAGKETELQQGLNDKVKELYQKLAERLLPEDVLAGIQFDSMSLEDIVSELNKVPEGLKDLVQPFLDVITKGRLAAEQQGQTFEQAFNSANEQLNKNAYGNRSLNFIRSNLGYASMVARSQGVGLADAFGKTNGWDKNWTIDPNVAAALSLYDNNSISYGMIDDYLQKQMLGTASDSDYYNMLATGVFRNSYKNGTFSTENLAEDINAASQNETLIPFLNELISKYPDLTKAANGTEGAIDKLNEQWGADRLNDLTKYSKGTSNVATSLSKIKKGGKDASEGYALLNKGVKTYQDEMTAIQKAQGKSGKQLDSMTLSIIDSMFANIDSEDIKQMTKDELADLLKDAPDAINEAYSDDLQTIIDDGMGDANLRIDLGKVNVSTDGTVNLDQLNAACTNVSEEVLAQLRAMAGEYGSVAFEVDENGNIVSVKGVVEANKRNAYNSRKSGGGGGKSAIDKMLEEQKFRVSDIQHRIKMTQIDETYQSNSNNTDAYIQDLRNEASLYDVLEQELRNNIAEMEAQLKKLKEGSEEWKKLAEAIHAAKEELEDVYKNKDFELTGKEIDAVLRRQEIADKPGAQTRTMLDIYAQRAMSDERYADYYSLSEQDLAEINSQKEMNTAQIAELEEQLKNAVEGDENWIKTRDQIWEIEAENAKLENEAIQKQLEINETRLAQIAQVLQYDTGAANHNNNIAQTYQQYYQTGGYRSQYEDMINAQKENNDSILEDTQAAYESALEQMNSLDEGTPAWYKARDAVYQYQESIAQLTVTQEDLNRALAESKLDSIAETYTDATRESSHVMDLNRSIASEALSEDDTETYQAAMEQVAEMRAINLEKEREALASLLDEYESGMENGTLDPNMQRQYLDAINEREKAVLAMVQERAQQEREINKETIEQIKQDSEDLTRESTHVSNLTQMQANQYLAMGDYDAYQAMMGRVGELENTNTEALQSRLAEIRKAYDEGIKNGTLDADSQRSLLNMENETEEAIVKAYIAASNRMKEISKSNLNEIMRDNQMATRDSIRLTDLWKAQADEYLANNNYEGYAESMENAQRTVTISLEEETRTLEQLKATYNELMETGNLDAADQITWLNNIDQQQKKVLQTRQTQIQSERQKDSTMLNKLFEDNDRDASNMSHNNNLLQYQASVFQNRGELTNYNAALNEASRLNQEEIEQRTARIAKYEERIAYFRDKYGPGSDAEYRLTDAIKKEEEAIESLNVNIDRNNKLREENEKKILSLQKALEDTIDQEIEDRKRREREQLAASVSMQEQIVDTIRKRYQDEWDLRKKDLDKEKESLNEYKRLINERFNYRKKASQQADKDEELAEYRKQLALIEADPIRTKDAKELRRKIEELEEERSWTIAEDELNNENERVDDQIKTTDDYIAYTEEKLNEFLSDANNFATELNEIISGTFEESYPKIISFFETWNEEYIKSLSDVQKQTVQSWEDGWKTAKGIIDSNAEQIDSILNGGKDSYLEFMSGNALYQSYLEHGDETNAASTYGLWKETFDNAEAAKRDDEYRFIEHDHEVEESNAGEMLLSGDAYIYDPKQLVINTNSISLGNNYLGLDDRAIVNRTAGGNADLSGYDPKDITGKGIDPSGFDNSNIKWTDKSTGEQYELNAYEGIGKLVEETKDIDDNAKDIAENTAPGTSNNNGERWYIYDENGKMLKETSSYNAAVSYRDKNVPGRNVITQVAPDSNGYNLDVAKRFVTTEEKTKAATETATNWLLEVLKKNFTNSIKDMLPQHANGGLVDYTGLAWVDGTKSRPESFLDATDTALLRGMLDAFDYVSVPSFHAPDFSSMMTGNTVGDINITINQAELKEDADYDKVAKKIGKAFTKELGKQGLSLAGYSFT